MHFLMGTLACLVVIMVGVMIYDSNRFHRVTYEIASDRIDKDFRFVFLSDLHNKQYGQGNKKLLDAIDACNPEAVFIGGDVLTATPGKSVEPAAQFVKELAERYLIYYANGNHEQRLDLYPETYGDMGKRYEELLSQASIVRLVNEAEYNQSHNAEVIGCQIDRRFYKRFKKVPMDGSYLQEILPKKSEGMYTILLAHNPDYFQAYKEWGADLTLSGHVHGGVMRLPLLGGVLGTNFRFFPQYDGGMFEEDGKVMIVSRGLGAHTIPLRIFNPAELVEVVIKRKTKEA